jgi:NTP pyrophosphatase (non-canonical NTP hydrolase)
MDLSLKSYQARVDSWVRTYGVRYFNEMTNLAILTEEVGEVARVMVRTYGEQSFKSEEQALNSSLSDELADVLFVVACIANQTGIDLAAAVEKNLEKKSRRDSLRHWQNPKLSQDDSP